MGTGVSKPVTVTGAEATWLPGATPAWLGNVNTFGTASAARVVLAKVAETPPMSSTGLVVVANAAAATWRTQTACPCSIAPGALRKVPVQPIEYCPSLVRTSAVGTEAGDHGHPGLSVRLRAPNSQPKMLIIKTICYLT